MKKLKKVFQFEDINRIKLSLLVETLYIFITELIFKYLVGNLFLDWTLVRIFITSFLLSGFFNLITANLKDRIRVIILIIINFIITLYAWLQIGFLEYLGNFLSIGNAGQGTKITDLITDFLKAYRPIVYIIYLPFVLILIYYIFEEKITKNGYYRKLDFKNKNTYFKIAIYYVTLISLLMFTINIDFMQNKYQTISNRELFKYPSNLSYTIKNYGITFYLVLDIKGTIIGDAPAVSVNKEVKTEYKKDYDEAWVELIKKEDNNTLNTLNYYYINREIKEDNEYTGIFKGKNLIVILLESVGYPVFTEEYKEYFPTLYKMQSEGISAVNNYSPRNNCSTGESEMESEIGLYPTSSTCTPNTYNDNVYREALMYMFNNNGYYTSAYHNYTDTYYDRGKLENNYGASVYYDASDLGMKKHIGELNEWPSDVDLIKRSVPKFVNNTPFASYMITVTPHLPYIIGTEYGDKYLYLFEDLKLSKSAKRYLSKIKVLDDAMEELLKELSDEGILDDTVIVLYGDHYPYALSNSDYKKIAPYEMNGLQDLDRTPFIIYNSETGGVKITKYTSPIDYAPTLFNLFGIDYDSRLYIGNDIFSEYEDYVAFSDNSWINSNGYYSARSGKFTKSKSSTIKDEDILRINNEITEKKSMSSLAIKRNYFDYLYNNIRKE